MDRTTTDTRLLRHVWLGALGVFVLAGLTGVLYRSTVAFGWTPEQVLGLDLGNVRHAHSHLMYFGWATPALMALMVHHVQAQTGRRVRGAGVVLGATFVLALLAYVPFLLYGYSPAIIGEARLPLSVMAAGFNVFAWYAFVGVYVRAMRGVERTDALWVFDLALFFLVLATMGAWGLPLLQPLGIDNPALTAALTHVFLDLFSEGWFVLGVLGLVYAKAEGEGAAPRWPVYLAAAGVPFTFALALPTSYVPALWKTLASVGGVFVGVGLLAAALMLARRRIGWLWRVALALLAFKALGQVVVALTPGMNWPSLIGMRVLYLHLMLLGFVSLGVVAAAGAALGARRGQGVMATAVLLLLLSLLPLTAWWPAALAGRWAFVAAALVAPGPIIGALCLAAGAWQTQPPALRRDHASRPSRSTFPPDHDPPAARPQAVRQALPSPTTTA